MFSSKAYLNLAFASLYVSMLNVSYRGIKETPSGSAVSMCLQFPPSALTCTHWVMSPAEEQSLRIAALERQVEEEKTQFSPSIPITFTNYAAQFILYSVPT